ncbi:unnamed protein product [Lactuca virosa]|uniref:Uncharacterized protein n=1 Tax=Lactuca virosa TaxID=75947 RepID=A0AAU9M081_9ASTR|nr:unnamed protein product [Lactuca virosa]
MSTIPISSTRVNSEKRVLENLSKMTETKNDVHETNKERFERAAKIIIERRHCTHKQHIAASKWHKMIGLLIKEKEADFDVYDDLGRSPLLEAIEGKHDRIIDFLTKNGARLRKEDSGHFLCLAVATDDVGYVGQLLECGMVADSQNKDNQTPLHIAAR